MSFPKEPGVSCSSGMKTHSQRDHFPSQHGVIAPTCHLSTWETEPGKRASLATYCIRGLPELHEALVSKISLRVWRRDSAVKNMCCPYTGPGFTSQHTHGDSKLELQFLGAWYSLLTSMGTRLACGINTYTQAKHS